MLRCWSGILKPWCKIIEGLEDIEHITTMSTDCLLSLLGGDMCWCGILTPWGKIFEWVEDIERITTIKTKLFWSQQYLWEGNKKRCMRWQHEKNVRLHFFKRCSFGWYEYKISLCNDRKRTSTFLLLPKREIYVWGNWYDKNLEGLRLLSSHRKGTLVTFTVFFNTSSLLSNNAYCTVTFRTHSNTSILIGKQIVYWLSLADYQVIIHFKVNHLRVCWWQGGDDKNSGGQRRRLVMII